MEPIKRDMIVSPKAPVSEALRKMTEENQGRLLVMGDNQMVGMITQTGVLRYLEIHKALAGPVVRSR